MSATMDETMISLAERTGPVPSGRGQAEVVRAEIETELGRVDEVTVDLTGIVAMSPSFGDELFAKLADEIAAGRVRFENVAPSVASLARFVTAGRRERESS